MALEPILFVSEPHRPYHHQRAWSLMIKAAKELRPKHLITIGDFADCYTISSYSKDPARALCLEEEVADVNRGLDELDDLGAKEKIFTEGNHCDRLRRYLQDKAPELFKVVSIPALFHLKERGWHFVPYKRHTKVGKLFVTHDCGAGGAGRYAAFKSLDTYQHSIVTGHSHRLSYVVEGNAVGEHKVSAQFGWLGDVEQIDYMHQVEAKKNWALGFGIGYLDPSTNIVYLTPVPIVQTKGGELTCVVNGKMYRG